MIINIPKNKLYKEIQELDFTHTNIYTLIGGNGSGKSSILEAVFKKYINKDDKRVICFSSGQNELFYSIFDKHKSKNYKHRKENDSVIDSYYFDYFWVRFLVFFATSLKKDGLVRKYLKEKQYIQENELKDDVSSKISFRFRVKSYYANQIKQEIAQEALTTFDPEQKLFRKSVYHKVLENFIEKHINRHFDFSNGDTIRLSGTTFRANKVIDIFPKNIDQIFTFLSHATRGWQSNIILEEVELKFDNNLEFEQLSDGEYQLLSIYALLDLFDNKDTIFLFDEIDSHLHYTNIEKLWALLKTVEGKIITTTHISESIIQNDFSSLTYIENGKIEKELTAQEVFKKLSQVTGASDYEYKIASKIQYIALLDDEVDWIIFKKLVIKKIVTEDVLNVLDQVIPYKRTSSYNDTNEIFGKSKLLYVNNFKEKQITPSKTKGIFLICDRDKLPLTEIKDDLSVTIDKNFNHIKSFNSNNTKTYLLSWRMLEIENYLLSKTMLQHYGKLDELKEQHIAVNFDGLTSLDESEDIRTYDAKLILHPLYKDGSFDESRLDEIIDKIPQEEISNDIVKMYNFIKSKVED